MKEWLDAQSSNSFTAYSTAHLAALMIFALLLAALFLSRHWLRDRRRCAITRYALAAVLMLCELSLNAWYLSENMFDVSSTLPLELCTVSLYMCVAMLLLRSRAVFQIVYFTGIGGAMQAILTPVLYYDFPHYRFIEFFAAHFAIILAVLHMVWVEGFRPTMKSIAVTMVFLNLLAGVVYAVNIVTGGNYMFLSRKPETASLLDFLGPHPWYLLSLEGVVLILCLLLYLPFAGKKPMPASHPQRSVTEHLDM